jgi:hypothetical protein
MASSSLLPLSYQLSPVEMSPVVVVVKLVVAVDKGNRL